jgi:hypothetical protein
MRHILDKAFVFAALTAIVWMAVAVQLAAHAGCSGPTVALVRPFGGALAVAVERSAP